MTPPTLPMPPGPASPFAAWMAHLDALQDVRMRDPAGALAQLRGSRSAWQGLQADQAALLEARFALQTAAAHLVLGAYDDCRRECLALDTWLQSPALQAAGADLRHQANRCAIAGANAKAFLAHSTGDFAGALRAYLDGLERAVQMGDRTYQARLRVNLANTYEECGLAAQALDEGRQALDLARSLGLDELVADIHHNIGNALAMLGDSAQGLASNQAALQAYTGLGLPQKQGYALVAVAERLLELGRAADAAQALAQRQGLPVDYVNPQYKAYADYLAGRIAVALGRHQQARHDFASALSATTAQLGDRVGQARSHLQLAQLDLAEHQPDEAWRQGQLALGLLAGTAAQRDLYQTHALLSQAAKARGDLALALQHHEAFHAGYAQSFNTETARKAGLLAVRHEVDLLRGEAQRERLEKARLADALAEISARRSGQSRADGAVSRPEDLRGLGLTPREAEVLFWVTQGKTNDDVTLILGISVSAVKKHLVNIYNKLGVDNRTAAADAVRRRRPA